MQWLSRIFTSPRSRRLEECESALSNALDALGEAESMLDQAFNELRRRDIEHAKLLALMAVRDHYEIERPRVLQ